MRCNIKGTFKISMAFLAILILTGCGVESYQPVISLAAPLGFTCYETNSTIVVQFYGENDEIYFSGYYIYMGQSQADLLNNTGMTLLNSAGRSGQPSIITTPSTTPQLFNYTVTYYTNYSALQAGVTYYFDAKAYSQQYNVYSDASNITNITFQ